MSCLRSCLTAEDLEDLRKLRNIRNISNLVGDISQCPDSQKLIFDNSGQKTCKSRYKKFLVLSNFTEFIYFVLSTLFRIVDRYHHLTRHHWNPCKVLVSLPLLIKLIMVSVIAPYSVHIRMSSGNDNNSDNEKHFFGRNNTQCYKYTICK